MDLLYMIWPAESRNDRCDRRKLVNKLIISQHQFQTSIDLNNEEQNRNYSYVSIAVNVIHLRVVITHKPIFRTEMTQFILLTVALTHIHNFGIEMVHNITK